LTTISIYDLIGFAEEKSFERVFFFLGLEILVFVVGFCPCLWILVVSRPVLEKLFS
jgi:hypothetical protein